MPLSVVEIFHSLQGEGRLAGVPSVFVRLAGCPLRCRWCDTRYAWSDSAGRQYEVPELIRSVDQWACRYVVITGGEPLVHADLADVCRRLRAAGKHITIETAGIADPHDLECDLMSISPKMRNSTPDDPKVARLHELRRINLPVLRRLIASYDYQLKFVIDSAEDMGEITQLLADIDDIDPAAVMLMPQAETRRELLDKSPMVAQLCTSTGLAFCQRLHILLWDKKRGV